MQSEEMAPLDKEGNRSQVKPLGGCRPADLDDEGITRVSQHGCISSYSTSKA